MHRQIIAVGIVALLVVGSVAPVTAQQVAGAPGTETGASPAPPERGQSTANQTAQASQTNQSAANESAGQNATAGSNESNENGTAGGTLGGSLGGGFDLSLYEPNSPVCEGLDPATGYACDGTVDTLFSLANASVDFYRQTMGGVITFIVNRPRAMQGGEMAIFGAPTNEPMGTVYDYWRDTALPVAFGLWVLFVLLNQFRDVFPVGANSQYARRQFTIRAWVILGFMIASWGFGQTILHMSHLVATTLAPGAEQLAPDFQSIQADSAAAVLAALAIYFGAGFVALLAALQFIIVYIAIYFLLPALPLALALSLPDFWLFNKLQPVGQKLVSWFPTCAFYTVPTALVLGVGYPISGALAEATPDMLAFIPGISAATGVLLGILQLGVWFLALIAPLVVFALGSPTRAAGAVAGAVGGFTLGATSGAASGSATGAASGAASSAGTAAASSLPAAGASATSGAAKSVGTSPISGSSLAGTAGKTGTASSTSGALTGATSAPTAASTGGAGRAAQSALGGGGGGGETSLDVDDARRSSRSSGSTDTASVGGADADADAGHAPEVTTVRDRAAFDGSRKYEVGVYRDGEFSRFAPNSMRGEAIVDRGRGIQLQEARHGGDDDLVIRDEESGDLFDVTNIAERDRDLASQQTPVQQNTHSRDAVFNTRDARDTSQ